jgi:hypothetical protein
MCPKAHTELPAAFHRTISPTAPGPSDERLCRARFLKLRELLASNRGLVRRLHELEAHIEDKLTAHDRAIAAVLSEIRQLTNPPTPKQRPMGFTANLREDK